MTMIAAIYARKSPVAAEVADDAKSITRQVEHARAYAARKGWTVSDDLLFVDDNISGAEFESRHGFLRLMNALKPRPPFQVVIVAEQSRLGRESIETAYAIKQLDQAGVAVWTYLDGKRVTLDSPTDKLLMSVASYADEMERERSRQRTYDTMLRKAKAGHVTGGRVFGYDSHEVTMPGPDGLPRRSHVERRINEAEAAVVREIFQRCAAGDGKTRIAKHLNAIGAVSPRAQRGRPQSWAPSSVHEALYRELYRGRIVWNQSRKRNKWGQQQQHARPEAEWLVVPAPHLQIVSDDLWAATHARLADSRGKYLRATGGRLWGRPRDLESKYLLTGFARCGDCGGSVVVRTYAHGRLRAPFYGCLAHHQRGACVCQNRVKVPMSAVDDAVLDALADDILQPDIVEDAIRRAVEQLAPGARQQEAVRLRAELATVERTIKNLMDALAAGGNEVASLVSRLKAEEHRKLDLEAQIATAEHLATAIDVNAIRAKLEARLTEWRELLRQQVTQTRQMLRKILDGPVTLTPLPDGSGVRVEGQAAYGKILEGLVPLSSTLLPVQGNWRPHPDSSNVGPGPRCVASPAGVEPASPP
jgi:site-specific DNA recombinase